MGVLRLFSGLLSYLHHQCMLIIAVWHWRACLRTRSGRKHAQSPTLPRYTRVSAGKHALWHCPKHSSPYVRLEERVTKLERKNKSLRRKVLIFPARASRSQAAKTPILSFCTVLSDRAQLKLAREPSNGSVDDVEGNASEVSRTEAAWSVLDRETTRDYSVPGAPPRSASVGSAVAIKQGPTAPAVSRSNSFRGPLPPPFKSSTQAPLPKELSLSAGAAAGGPRPPVRTGSNLGPHKGFRPPGSAASAPLQSVPPQPAPPQKAAPQACALHAIIATQHVRSMIGRHL